MIFFIHGNTKPNIEGSGWWIQTKNTYSWHFRHDNYQSIPPYFMALGFSLFLILWPFFSQKSDVCLPQKVTRKTKYLHLLFHILSCWLTSSKTVLRPSWVYAEHSRYWFSLSFLTKFSPISFVMGFCFFNAENIHICQNNVILRSKFYKTNSFKIKFLWVNIFFPPHIT